MWASDHAIQKSSSDCSFRKSNQTAYIDCINISEAFVSLFGTRKPKAVRYPQTLLVQVAEEVGTKREDPYSQVLTNNTRYCQHLNVDTVC